MIAQDGKEMPTVGCHTDDGVAGMTSSTERSAPRPLLRRLGWSTLALCASVVLLVGLGFLWFIRQVPAVEVTLTRDADGIVALTGGASRIADAIELLASGRGRRLLISGAYRATNSTAISRLNPDFERSLNTLGNAIETKRWAKHRGFRSLIVVTSNYHMPRALAEIAHQLPDVVLVPFPVVTDRQRVEPWWTDGVTARRMVTEYVKYVFVRLRMGLKPSAGSQGAS